MVLWSTQPLTKISTRPLRGGVKSGRRVRLTSSPPCNCDAVIGTESWFKGDIGNAEELRADFTTFRRDRSARGGGVFMCVKNPIACTELWVDEDFEMIGF
jgi:hypothetical protein